MGTFAPARLGVFMWEGAIMNKREWMLQAALMWVRAGHGGSSDEVATVLSGTYDAICAATAPETAQEGAWVEHDGDVSKAPPEGQVVEVIFRDGSRYSDSSEGISWDHVQEAYDVLRWRYA